VFGEQHSAARRLTGQDQAAWFRHGKYAHTVHQAIDNQVPRGLRSGMGRTNMHAERAVTPALQIIYEDNHLLAVNKPALLPTMGSAAGDTSLWSECKDYLQRKYNKPGNVFLGVVSRLDAQVTGVVVFARTSKAAGRLSRAFRERAIEKEYWAIVSGRIRPQQGQWTDWLVKDPARHKMVVSSSRDSTARQAILRYSVVTCGAGHVEPVRTLVRIELLTGRKHQIRVQLAHRGHPIVGDRKYGSRDTFARGIALHARKITFEHPVRKLPLTLEAPLPASWQSWGFQLPE
jgi:23S rRNA pseudouridine1911/1915/1917 synthase